MFLSRSFQTSQRSFGHLRGSIEKGVKFSFVPLRALQISSKSLVGLWVSFNALKQKIYLWGTEYLPAQRRHALLERPLNPFISSKDQESYKRGALLADSVNIGECSKVKVSCLLSSKSLEGLWVSFNALKQKIYFAGWSIYPFRDVMLF